MPKENTYYHLPQLSFGGQFYSTTMPTAGTDRLSIRSREWHTTEAIHRTKTCTVVGTVASTTEYDVSMMWAPLFIAQMMLTANE